MPTLVKKEESHSDAATSSKDELTGIPTLYLIADDSISEIVAKVRDGLSHLKVNVISDLSEEEALKKATIMVLLKHDPEMLKKAWANGVVPVTKAFTDAIKDYNPNTESGNSFVFENTNEWEVYAAIVRALETYKFPYDWKFIVRSCTKSA